MVSDKSTQSLYRGSTIKITATTKVATSLDSVIAAQGEKKSDKEEVHKMQKVVNEQVSGNMPEKKFRAGAVAATVWLNKGENGEYRTISIERNYKDKSDKWQSTNSLRINDLPKATVVLQKAYEFLVLNEQDLFNGGKKDV